MYGSSFVMVTFKPRASKIAASEEAAMPLPKDDTTPPVINMNFVIIAFKVLKSRGIRVFYATINKPRKLDENRGLSAPTGCVSSF